MGPVSLLSHALSVQAQFILHSLRWHLKTCRTSRECRSSVCTSGLGKCKRNFWSLVWTVATCRFLFLSFVLWHWNLDHIQINGHSRSILRFLRTDARWCASLPVWPDILGSRSGCDYVSVSDNNLKKPARLVSVWAACSAKVDTILL